MSEQTGKVVHLDNVQSAPTSHGGGGDGGGGDQWRATVDARLSALEKDVSAINERTKHLASREDVQRLQTELLAQQNKHLKWIIGGLVFAAMTGAGAFLAAIANVLLGGA